MATQPAQKQYVSVLQPTAVERSLQVIAVLHGQLPAVDVAPPGHTIHINWAPVYGATRAEISSAVVQIGTASVQQSLGDLMLTPSGNAYEVTVPNEKRIASLTLFDCKKDDSNITSQSTLPTDPEQHRLVVTTREGGTISAPLYAVPASPPRHMLPASLIGANFNNKVLSLPDLKAAKIRLSLVIKQFPDEFQEQSFTLTRVSGVATISPTNLELVDPTGTVIWSFPGEYPEQNPPTEVDLRVNLEPALNTALKNKQPLDVTFQLRGAAPSKAGFMFAGAKGALVREVPGVLTTTLAGDPVQLALGNTLASEAPSSVVTDLTVTYDGIRLLEELSDTVPTAGPVSGRIVSDQQIARAFPPQAFVNRQIARIGLIGRAPQACELSLQMVKMIGERPGAPLGPPGILTVSTSTTIETHWVELPPNLDLSQSDIGIAVRTNQGRFFWVTGGNDTPLVKIAIHDPTPGGRPLRLNGTQILKVAQTGAIHLPATTLAGQLFQTRAPSFDSALFLTIDVSDLTLRYAR